MTTNVSSQYEIQESIVHHRTEQKDRRAFWQIVGIWLAGGAPMWLLSWGIYPLLSAGRSLVDAGLLLEKLMIIGLVWEFVLSMLILYREEGNIWISTIRRRFWLNNPVSPEQAAKTTDCGGCSSR